MGRGGELGDTEGPSLALTCKENISEEITSEWCFRLAKNDRSLFHLEDVAQLPQGHERGPGARSWDVLSLGQQGRLGVKVADARLRPWSSSVKAGRGQR